MQSFMHAYPDFPKGKVVKTESPDFLLHLNRKKTIGIELTRLHTASSLTEAIDVTLLNKDEKYRIYSKRKLSACWLIIHFDSILLPYKFNLNNLLSKYVIQSSYDRVFLFDTVKSDIFEFINKNQDISI